MELNDELDALLVRKLAESSTEFTSAMSASEKIIRDSRVIETALREGEVFPDFSLPDSTGAIVQSADLLTLGPLIVSFYKGQWCPFCNLELNALQLALPEIEELGGALVAVLPETLEHTANALTRFSFSFYTGTAPDAEAQAADLVTARDLHPVRVGEHGRIESHRYAGGGRSAPGRLRP